MSILDDYKDKIASNSELESGALLSGEEMEEENSQEKSVNIQEHAEIENSSQRGTAMMVESITETSDEYSEEPIIRPVPTGFHRQRALDAKIQLGIYPLGKKFQMQNRITSEDLINGDQVLVQKIDTNILSATIWGGMPPYKIQWNFPNGESIQSPKTEISEPGLYSMYVYDSATPEPNRIIRTVMTDVNTDPLIVLYINSMDARENETVYVHQKTVQINAKINVCYLTNEYIGYVLYMNENEINSGLKQLNYSRVTLELGQHSLDAFPSYLELILFNPENGDMIDNCIVAINVARLGHFGRSVDRTKPTPPMGATDKIQYEELEFDAHEEEMMRQRQEFQPRRPMVHPSGFPMGQPVMVPQQGFQKPVERMRGGIPMAQPSMAQPSMAQPSMAQPLMTQPSMAQPLMTQPKLPLFSPDMLERMQPDPSSQFGQEQVVDNSLINKKLRDLKISMGILPEAQRNRTPTGRAHQPKKSEAISVQDLDSESNMISRYAQTVKPKAVGSHMCPGSTQKCKTIHNMKKYRPNKN